MEPFVINNDQENCNSESCDCGKQAFSEQQRPIVADEHCRLAHKVFIKYVQDEMIHSPAILYTSTFICPHRVSEAPDQNTNMAQVQYYGD